MDELIDRLKPIYQTKTDERIISHQIDTSRDTYVLDTQIGVNSHRELTPPRPPSTQVASLRHQTRGRLFDDVTSYAQLQVYISDTC